MNVKMNRLQSNSFFAAVIFAFIFCICFSFGISKNSSAGAINLEYRINPNQASAASLMRLPGIGISKANAIVQYRRQFQQNNLDNLAFQNCSDLDKIKGIGPATLSNICEYLKFGRE
jgi:competence protein ComEA